MRWPVIRPRTGASIGDVRPSTRASYESNIKRHDAGTLSVRQTLIAPAYKLAVSTPKTKKGRRKVALDSATVDALRVHRRKQLEERLAFGGDYPTTLDTFEDLVFREADGEPVNPVAFSKRFERAVTRLDLRSIPCMD